MATLFELKEKMAELSASIKADAEWIAEKAADPATPIDDINAKKAHRDELQTRLAEIKGVHDEMEAMQREAVRTETKMSAKDQLIASKAAFYRDAFAGNVKKSYEGLGAIPVNTADLGYGEKLLPTNMSRELLMEPAEKNPLRDIARVTNITGLEEPKLGFTIEDADLADVADTATANEIALTGENVVYGRLKAKVCATVKDTVLNGTPVDLVSAIESRLSGALAKREKMFAFKSATDLYNSGNKDTVHAHMSFYDYTSYTSASNLTYAITAKEGATMAAALEAALGDLADEFSENATIVMKKSDYYAMIEGIANHAESLFGAKPASFLGVPVVFCDKATIPVVGDFSYYGINYDIGTIFQTDQDAKKGEYYFVLTAWGDQQIRLKSAFRLAIVNP
jgi:HK97 family phage major capsid protein